MIVCIAVYPQQSLPLVVLFSFSYGISGNAFYETGEIGHSISWSSLDILLFVKQSII